MTLGQRSKLSNIHGLQSINVKVLMFLFNVKVLMLLFNVRVLIFLLIFLLLFRTCFYGGELKKKLGTESFNGWLVGARGL